MRPGQAMRDHASSTCALLGLSVLCLLCLPVAADTASEGGPANPAAATALLEYDSGLARAPAAGPATLPWGAAAARREAPQGAAAAQADTVARVLTVNRRTGEVLLEHGPIARLQMPAMTMLFRAASAAVLRQLREGERVGVAVSLAGQDMLVTAVFRP